MKRKKIKKMRKTTEETKQVSSVVRRVAFDSGLIVLEPVILIPVDVALLLKSIQKKVGSNEYSVLLNGVWTSNGFQIESNKFYIPKQEVSSTSVDYKEELYPLTREYNTIYHSHPFSTNVDFSRADREHLVNFECSLLGNNTGEPQKAILLIEVDIDDDTILLEIQANIEISSHLTDVNVDNIVEKRAHTDLTYANTEDTNWYKRYWKGDWL